MGKGLSCAFDRDPIYDISMSPNLLKELTGKSKSHSIHRVYFLETKTASKKYSNCAHYSDLQQSRRDKPTIGHPKKLNVEFPVPVKESEVESMITIPSVLRKQKETSLKLSSVAKPENERNCIKHSSWQYQNSENPSTDVDRKTSRIPDEIVSVLLRWIKSENIGLEALIEGLKTDVQLKAESAARGNEISSINCQSDFEIQSFSISINLHPDNSDITHIINHITSTSSTISKQGLARAPCLDKRYESGTWMDDINYASECSDCTSEELIQFHEEDFFAFLKTQQERSRSRRVFAGKILANLPPLSQSFKEISRCSWTDVNDDKVSTDMLPAVSPDIEEESSTGSLRIIITDIELLEQSIKEKTVRINKLREQSVDILTTGYETDLKYESGGDTAMSMWLNVEKKVNLLKDEKLDLEKKKDAMVSQLQCLNYLKPEVLQNFPLPISQDCA